MSLGSNLNGDIGLDIGPFFSNFFCLSSESNRMILKIQRMYISSDSLYQTICALIISIQKLLQLFRKYGNIPYKEILIR